MTLLMKDLNDKTHWMDRRPERKCCPHEAAVDALRVRVRHLPLTADALIRAAPAA